MSGDRPGVPTTAGDDLVVERSFEPDDDAVARAVASLLREEGCEPTGEA